jgi:hypothetical protein
VLTASDVCRPSEQRRHLGLQRNPATWSGPSDITDTGRADITLREGYTFQPTFEDIQSTGGSANLVQVFTYIG